MTDHSDIILISFKIILWHFQFFKQHWHYEKMVKCVNVLKCQQIIMNIWVSTKKKLAVCVFMKNVKVRQKSGDIFCMYILIRAKLFAIIWRVDSNIFLFSKKLIQIFFVFINKMDRFEWVSLKMKMLESTLQIMANDFASIKIYMKKLNLKKAVSVNKV